MMYNKQTGERREHFRVRYPYTERPRMIIDNGTYSVMDISEHGLRFAKEDDLLHDFTNEALKGVLSLGTGRKLFFEGKVVRNSRDEVGVYINDALPFDTILEELNHLIIKNRTTH